MYNLSDFHVLQTKISAFRPYNTASFHFSVMTRSRWINYENTEKSERADILTNSGFGSSETLHILSPQTSTNFLSICFLVIWRLLDWGQTEEILWWFTLTNFILLLHPLRIRRVCIDIGNFTWTQNVTTWFAIVQAHSLRVSH